MLTVLIVTSGGTCSWIGAKLMIPRIPAATTSSTTRCAATAGTAITAMSTGDSRLSSASALMARTGRLWISRPILSGSAS